MNVPHDVSRWTVDRRTFVGGSEIAAVCGLHPTITGLDVWASKVDGYERQVGPEAEVGLEYEEPTARLYARRLDVREPLEMRGSLVDPAFPWAGATPDRLRIMPANECINVQIKIVGLHSARLWDRVELGPEAIPTHVHAQVTWEARAIEAATGMRVDLTHLVANVGGTDIRVYHIPHDREFGALLFECAREWWEAFVVPRVMPEITEENAESARKVIAHRYPRETLPALAPGHEHLALAREYGRLRGAAKRADSAVDACAAKLCAVIGDSVGFASDDERIRVTWKATAKGNRTLRVDIKED